jgi:hypothetical protein
VSENWIVLLVAEVNEWFGRLIREDAETADLVEDALDLLAEHGPSLGRPMVDTIQGSSIHNMKELRPASAGRSEVRMLFVFDPWRRAVLLVAGDKSGNWTRWYEQQIPVAEQRYRSHIAELDERKYE